MQHVKDGNKDIDVRSSCRVCGRLLSSQQGITNAIREAQKAHDRPSLIKVTTIIGIGRVFRLLVRFL